MTDTRPQTTTELTLSLIQSGGPITFDDLAAEIHTLQRVGVLVTDPGFVRKVQEALRLHAGAERIRLTPDGWEYTPPAETNDDQGDGQPPADFLKKKSAKARKPKQRNCSKWAPTATSNGRITRSTRGGAANTPCCRTARRTRAV